MVRFTWQTALILSLGLIGACSKTPRPKEKASNLPVKLGKLPDVRLVPRPPVSELQARQIKGLITGLAGLDKPDFGLSATLSGDAFAPIPGQSHAGTFVLTDHAIQPSEGLKTLVSLGPDALPFLLDALDDQTPTKIVIKHTGRFLGSMWHAAELPFNPVNPVEEAFAKKWAEGKINQEALDRERMKKSVESYTVKVGDVCFVAIGQIVGRGFQAVRYQPTACIVLNCPTHDPKLAAEIRAIWRHQDPRTSLFDSLCADYATEGVFEDKSLDGWSSGSDLQCGAVLRLLYYFPKEASSLVAARLDQLDVGKDRGSESHVRRCIANRVRANDFVKATAWTKDPVVRAAIVRLFKRADDMDSLLAALPAVTDQHLIRSRLEPLIDALPAKEAAPYGKGYSLLAAVAQRTPGTARTVFERYLQSGSVQRRHTGCLVLRNVKMEWDAELLGPLLLDKRTWGWTFAVEPDKNEPRLPIRVCDEAAVTLSLNHPELKFAQAGEHADLDKQIAAIQAQLMKKK